MENFFNKDFKLGILGGGQLGRMFIQEAINYNLDVKILDPSPIAPCSTLATEFVVGDLNDYDTVVQFGKGLSVLTIEIENVNIDALESLEKEGVKVYPKPNTLRIIKDKGVQKEFYKNNNIPTAPYFLAENIDDVKSLSSEFPVFQKLRVGGYDGKGVQSLKSIADLDKAFTAPSVLEKYVDFAKELSVIVARTPSGEIVSYPVVECEFNPEANLVEFLFSPANISNEIENKCQELAIQVIESLDFVGLLAVEIFLTKNGEVLVNEVAPRPHNSGHQTIEGNFTSQFEQHLRSILNMPLGDTGIVQPSVMINLLGEKGYQGNAVYEGLQESVSKKGVNVHLYGKKETKSFRKMGHVTVVNPDLEEAISIAKEVKEKLKIIA